MRLHFGILGLRLGILGINFGVFLKLWGGTLDPFCDFFGKGTKRSKKGKEKGAGMDVFPMKFLVFQESEKLRFDCAGASGLRFRPLIVSLCASTLTLPFLHRFLLVFGPPHGCPKARSAAEAGTPFYCLISSFRKFIIPPCSLRSGASPYSLKGSFGEPAAGSTSPSASTRPREFVFVFAVRS